jgi:hypothetical protein
LHHFDEMVNEAQLGAIWLGLGSGSGLLAKRSGVQRRT